MANNPRPPSKGRAVIDELRTFMERHGAFLVIILSVVAVRWLWSETKKSWKDWLRHLAVSLLVGGLLNMYLTDIPNETLGVGTKGVILALVVLQADHIFVGLMAMGQRFRDDPANFIRSILDIWRGRK